MLTSGLVSLNVHEPLTFEGTEICLHPDLFTPAAATATGTNTRSNYQTQQQPTEIYPSASFPTVASSSQQPTIQPFPSVSLENGGGEVSSGASGATTVAAASSTVTAIGTSVPPKHLLQVGDMIEIRVWDPIQMTATIAATKSASTNLETANHHPPAEASISAPATGPAPGDDPISTSSAVTTASSSSAGAGGESTSSTTAAGAVAAAAASTIIPDDINSRAVASTSAALMTSKDSGDDDTGVVVFSGIGNLQAASKGRKSEYNGLPEVARRGRGIIRSIRHSGQPIFATSAEELDVDQDTHHLPTTSCPPSPGTTVGKALTSDGSGAGSLSVSPVSAANTITGDKFSTGESSEASAIPSSEVNVVDPAAAAAAAAAAATAVAIAATNGSRPSVNMAGFAAAISSISSQLAATPTTTPELPPMFPRMRAATSIDESAADSGAVVSSSATTVMATNVPSHQHTSSLLPPKPKIVSQRSSSVSSSKIIMTSPSFGGASGSNSSINSVISMARPPSSSLKPRHVREISDMTADTTLYDNSGGAINTTIKSTSQGVSFPYSNSTISTRRGERPFGRPQELRTTDRQASDGDNALLYHAATCSEEDDDEEDDDDVSSIWTTNVSRTHTLRLSFVMLVTEKTLTSLKGTARTQVSLSRPIAELYNLSTYDMCMIRKIDKKDEAETLKSVSADFLLVTIKDQFISRGEMYFFQNSLLGSWIYQGQRLFEPSRGIQAHVREILHGDNFAPSGIITDQTKITFRSRSARLMWLVQMSSEMWEYASPYERNTEDGMCEVYFDRWISFVNRLFAEWKELETTHSLTVVFFSRTFVGMGPSILNTPLGWSGERDVYGRAYEDHFKIVLENETRPDFDSFVIRIKEAFVRYPSDVGWNLSDGAEARRPSSASQGNVLEAINVALNILQYHYFDRDLNRTGNSIVVVSAGNGVNEVDKGLASITYQRMMDNGIGSGMLSLALPPLHIAPFFLYVNDYQSVEIEGVDASGTYYEVPHWMHLSFVSYADDASALHGHRSTQTTINIHAQEKRVIPFRNIGGRLVAANGFILSGPLVDEHDGKVTINTPLHSKTFSAQGNSAASPKIKQHSQERQLIADREIQDILEACRPRCTGLVPTSLKALLKMHRRHVELAKDPALEAMPGEGKDPSLAEWGSIENDIAEDASPLRPRSTVVLGHEPRVEGSPLLLPLPSPPRVDELDRANEYLAHATSPSSYASHLSTSALGAFYNRLYPSYVNIPIQVGLQLQRTASLDTLILEDNKIDVVQSDAESNSTTGLDLGVDYSVESGNEDKEGEIDEKFREALRSQMREHDRCNVARRSPQLPQQPNLSRNWNRDSFAGEMVRSTSLFAGQGGRGSTSNATGLGAALSQYRASSGEASSLQPDSCQAQAHGIRAIGGTMIPGMGASRARQIAEMGARGMSPLLLPPVLSFSTGADFAVRHHDGSQRQMPLEKYFVNPIDQATGTRQGLPASFNRQQAVFQSSIADACSSPRKIENGGERKSHVKRTSNSRSRRKKAFNPFRQEDEDEVLAQKSHNRRRWSHVFPRGEVEFKRHAGPSWKSLTIPAILPLSIDYFPPQQSVDHNYTFSIYNVTLSEFENTPYSSNQELLMEMVRQRITQDYQWVSPSHVNASTFRRESLRDGLANRGRSMSIGQTDQPDTMRQFLSMGHRLQVLTYDPANDIIEVTRYDAKSSQQKSEANDFKYHYLCFCHETQKFNTVVQTFSKYSALYNWNKVDRIICGDEDREMREGMRFKRIMFAIIPERFDSTAKEQEYTAKFLRLLEYLNKLRDNHFSPEQIDIKLVSTADKREEDVSGPVESEPGISRSSMQRFYIRLKKGKRESIEFIEVVLDSTFDTSWSFRIIFNWLVAGANKVETQLQLLQRRCTQFGLNLVPFPQITVSKNVFDNVFKAPAIFTLEDLAQVAIIDHELIALDYIHDGVFFTDARSVKECLENGNRFDFGRRWSRQPAGRQYVHRSGTLFVRLLPDLKGKLIVIVLGNYLYMSREPRLLPVLQQVFQALSKCINSLSERVISFQNKSLSPESSSHRMKAAHVEKHGDWDKLRVDDLIDV